MSSGVFENSKLFLHPIAEPIIDSIFFIGSGILATSCLTTWVNHPISNGGLVCASLLNATAIQLAKRVTHPNSSSYFTIASTVIALGITTISLPYLTMPFVNQLGVITGKAAFQIGLIHLTVKVGMYILQFLGSTNSDEISTSEIEKFEPSEKPEVIKNYSKKEATIAHTKLLSGGSAFLRDNFPNTEPYVAYFALFQKHDLLIKSPSIAEITKGDFGFSVFYCVYYHTFKESWSHLSLDLQFILKMSFNCHWELRHYDFFLFPNRKDEIATASNELITSIHTTAKKEMSYWFKLKFKPELNVAFKKHGLSEIV